MPPTPTPSPTPRRSAGGWSGRRWCARAPTPIPTSSTRRRWNSTASWSRSAAYGSQQRACRPRQAAPAAAFSSRVAATGAVHSTARALPRADSRAHAKPVPSRSIRGSQNSTSARATIRRRPPTRGWKTHPTLSAGSCCCGSGTPRSSASLKSASTRRPTCARTRGRTGRQRAPLSSAIPFPTRAPE